MLAATKVKVSGSEKNRANRNTNIFCIKRVNRNLKEVSRFSGAKQRQGNVQKSVLQVQSCFFANWIYCCCFLPFSLSSFASSVVF